MMKRIFFRVLILLSVFIFGIVFGFKLRDLLWIVPPGGGKSVFPSGEECGRDFHKGVTSLENVKNELGNPTNIYINDKDNDAFLELYYRTMKDKDAGCVYRFDRTGVLREILLRGSPVS